MEYDGSNSEGMAGVSALGQLVSRYPQKSFNQITHAQK